MSYRFVFGSAGSGKTHRVFTDCIAESLEDAGSRFLILVPEQYTTSAEREIVLRHPYHATDSISVTSFDRLAYLVFDELGIRNPEVLDDISKAMIIRRLAMLNERSLTVWKGRFDNPGFIDNLKSMISELCQYGLSPEFADELDISVLRPVLKGKLHDLKLIYSAFREYISGKYITREDIPDILSRVIDRSSLIKDAVIILDGFTGFTPVQYRIIESFMSKAREVIFTVTVGDEVRPYSVGSEDELFYMSKKMTARIVDLASGAGAAHGEDIRLGPAYAVQPGEMQTYGKRDPVNIFMEKHFLRYDSAGTLSCGSRVRIVKARSRSEEAAFIASDIAMRVRQGLRYRDIAVITAEPETYRDIFKREFAIEDIPFYMDEKLSLKDDPLPEMISAALEVISSGYSCESLMRFLRTGLVSDDAEMIDIMDIYMTECGKRGYSRMRASWSYVPKHLAGMSLDGLNTFKDAVLDLFEELKEACGSDTDRPGHIAAALIRMIDRCRCREKMNSRSEQFAVKGLNDKAREYSCACDEVIRLLSAMAKLFEGEKPARGEFESIFRTGISQIGIGVLPTGLDRVLVGDIVRSRTENIRLLYIAGANEGSIPRIARRGSVITDYEKEQLKTVGLELASTVREELYTQKFYLYRSFLKPSEQLTVSYSAKNEEGRDLYPSYIIDHLKSLFDDLETLNAEELIRPCGAKAALRLISGEIQNYRNGRMSGKRLKDFEGIYAYLHSGQYRQEIEDITGACLYTYTSDRISEEAALILYGKTLYTGVSGLKVYADCPYEYFVRYGLKLTEPEKYSVENTDIGNLIHNALETVFAMAAGRDLGNITDEERRLMVEKAVDQAVLGDPSAKYFDTARNRYLISRLKRITERSVWAFSKQASVSGFVPYEQEWGFSGADGLRSMNYDLGDGLKLSVSGRIDRVDICTLEDGRIAAAICDYKTGSTEWKLKDIINGKNLQTVLYMSAARELISARFGQKETVPAAMLIANISDPLLKTEDIKGKSREDVLLEKLAPSGIVNSEYGIPVLLTGNNKLHSGQGSADTRHMDLIVRYAENKIEKMGRKILTGDISISPEKKDNERTSCTYCRYRGICGFDEKIEGFGYLHQTSLKQDEVWEEIEKMDRSAASGN